MKNLLTRANIQLLAGVLLILACLGFFGYSLFQPVPDPVPGRIIGVSTSSLRQDVGRTVKTILDRPDPIPVPTQIADSSQVHLISVYEGSCHHEGNFHPRCPIQVSLAKIQSPVTLVLTAYEPIDWQIQNIDHVPIQQVITSGYYKQTVTGIGSHIPVIETSYEERSPHYFHGGFIHDTGGYDYWNQFIEHLAGKKPTTLQSVYRGTAFMIDGERSDFIQTRYQPTPQQSIPKRIKDIWLQCDGTCHFTDSYQVVQYTEPGTPAYTNNFYIASKRYVEVTIQNTPDQSPSYYGLNIGVVSQTRDPSGRLRPLQPSLINLKGSKPFKSGDIIGVAMDFDNHKLYFSRNGTWLNGNPNSDNGLSLLPNEGYSFALATLKSSLQVNFGATTFKYPLPAGYQSYADRASVPHSSKDYSKRQINQQRVLSAPEFRGQHSITRVGNQADFGSYIAELQRRIRRNWSPPREVRSKRVVVRFRIGRVGQVLSCSIKQSGGAVADRAALNAIRASAPFRPLPTGYIGSSIPVDFVFDYHISGIKAAH